MGVRLAAGVVALAAMLAGCGNGRAEPPRRSTAPPPRQSAGLTGARLRGALLSSFGKWVPVAGAVSGPWASLPGRPDASGVQDAPPGVVFKPANCKNAIWAGPDPARLGKSTAAMISLREVGDTSDGAIQAWDELIDLGGQPDQAVLGSGPVSGCRTVRASLQGRGLSFRENAVPPALGTRARAAVLGTSVPGDRQTWVVAFVGNGYAGTVFVQGAVTKKQVNAFASEFYRTARQKLG